jgi:hypothetical protein
LSIALLLVNDHVLKFASPSWLTGKLSDFAGMFFFPFIVAAGLSLILSKFRLTTHRIGVIAFGCVAIWFILLKTVQPVNFLTAHFASLFVGFPTAFSLDPTDLLSLFSMVAAWMIWTHPTSRTNSRLAYFSLLLGSFAAIATSPAYPGMTEVTNLEYYKDGIVYAADRHRSEDNNDYPVAKSLDGGLTWEEAPEVRNVEEKGLPIKHCSHLHPEICYKLTKTGKLQELASDGTWIDVEGLEIKTSYETKRVKVYDLILFEWEDKDYVIIAVGEYGIWRRELPDGDWSEISVLYADE